MLMGVGQQLTYAYEITMYATEALNKDLAVFF